MVKTAPLISPRRSRWHRSKSLLLALSVEHLSLVRCPPPLLTILVSIRIKRHRHSRQEKGCHQAKPEPDRPECSDQARRFPSSKTFANHEVSTEPSSYYARKSEERWKTLPNGRNESKPQDREHHQRKNPKRGGCLTRQIQSASRILDTSTAHLQPGEEETEQDKRCGA
jgi:hypothetical protein